MDQYKQYAISAMLAKFAYSNSDTLGDLWLKMHNSKRDNLTNVFKGVKKYPDFYNDDKTGAYGFSMLKDRTLYLVFRGTNDTQDAIVNLNLIRVPFFEGIKQCNIKVHCGFKKQYEALKEGVFKTLGKYLKEIDTVYVIGHSLGGALATLFAGEIARLQPEFKIVCHTFGSPRVGNKDYARWFQENVKDCVRITNREDPVVQIPISAFFQHVSDAKCIMDDLTVKDVPDGKWYWRLMNFRSNCCNPVLAHSCDQYIERLMKMYSELKKKGDENTPVTVVEEVKVTE